MDRTLRELRDRLARFDADLKQAVESEGEFHRCVLTFTTSVDSFIANQVEQDRHLQRLVDDDTRRTRNARNEYEALASNFYLHYPRQPPISSTSTSTKRSSSINNNNNNNNSVNSNSHNSFSNNNINDSNNQVSAAAVPTDDIDTNNTDGATTVPNVNSNNNNAAVINQQARRNDVNDHNVHSTKTGPGPAVGIGTTSTTAVATARRRRRHPSRLHTVFRCVVMYSGIVISVVVIAPIHFLFSYISRFFPVTASNANTNARDRITSAASSSNGNKKNNNNGRGATDKSKLGFVTTTNYNTLQQHRPDHVHGQHQSSTSPYTSSSSILTPSIRRHRRDAVASASHHAHHQKLAHDVQRTDGNRQGGVNSVANKGKSNDADVNNNNNDDEDDDTFVDAVNTSRDYAHFSQSGDYFSVASQDYNRDDLGGLGASSNKAGTVTGGSQQDSRAQSQHFDMDPGGSEHGLEDWVIPHRSDTASTRYDDDHSPFPPLDFWNISTDDLKLDMLPNADPSAPSDSMSRNSAT